jgi:hypothetical protein
MPIGKRLGRRPAAVGFAIVRELGLQLPGVEESTSYGAPSLKVRGQMFACMAAHRSAEPGSLVVRIPFADRDELIAADPDTYYLTDHYVNYASVVVRLGRVRRDALNDLLLMAWRFVTRAATDRKITRRRPHAGRRRGRSS